MGHRINPIHQPLPLIPKRINQTKQAPTQSFKTFLDQAKNELVISKHAQKRLDERNIHIDQKKWTTIQQKMNEARNKGVTDSVIVLNDAILVASTKNNTIITAMKKDEEQIVTNINGTIFIND